MFSIVIPLLDPFDRFVPTGTLQSLLAAIAQLQGEHELIIVSNNQLIATPVLTQFLEKHAAASSGCVKVVLPNANLGTARGFNAGWRLASPKSEFGVFMSSDADPVDRLMLVKILAVMEAHNRIGIAHPISVYEDFEVFNFGSEYSLQLVHRAIREHRPCDELNIPLGELDRIVKTVASKRLHSTPQRTTPLTFAVYRRAMLEDIGLFDEGVEFGCYETDDLAYRALLAGFAVARLDGVFVNHKRLYVRNLVLNASEQSAPPHTAIIKQSSDWWNKKWGRPYIELYSRWRWGPLVFSFMLPYFMMRRLAGYLRRRAWPRLRK